VIFLNLSKKDMAYIDGFTLEAVLKFQEGKKGISSRLENGKVVFLDREENPSLLNLKSRYRCLIREHPRYAFARIMEEIEK